MQIGRDIKAFILCALYLCTIPFSYVIAWLDRKIGFPLPFPGNIAELSAKKEWCIRTLTKSGALPAHAEIKDYKVTPLNQATIFRSNAGKLEITYGIHGKESVLKCFAKFAPTVGSVWNRMIFNVQLNHIKESLFNQHFINAGDGIPAPRLYYSDFSFLTGNLCLITELMDSCMEYQEATYEYLPEPQLELALEGLATLHATYWGSSLKKMEKVLSIEYSTVFLFDTIVASTWSKAARSILVKSWCRMNEEETVIHGDARIGNMMFPANNGQGRFVLIDWQAVRKGKAAYDLAYFLVLSLTPEHRGACEQKSIEHYYRALSRNSVSSYSLWELEEDYQHACLCVLVLLSLPLLSGEASTDAEGAKVFAWGMNIWRERLQHKFASFDYAWVASQYGISEIDARHAVAEMLGVIDARLQHITGNGF